VRVLTESESRVQSAPSSAEAHPGFAKDLEAAVLRAQENLFRMQKPEGYWNGELIVDSTLVSDMVVYHYWNGKVDKAWQHKAIAHLFSMQLPDGGWNIYHGGPSEVNATIKAYLALKLAGVPETDPRMLKAREVALHFGGVPRMNTFSKLYLALIGLFPWEYVPTIPVRGAAHRQMVPRQFLGHEQLVARHDRAAGHHQPFQAHPPGGRGFG
jgi:squalene cyclase